MSYLDLTVRPRVIGLDLAANRSGVALPSGSTITLTAPAPARRERRTYADDMARLDYLAEAVTDLIGAFPPDLVVLEDYAAKLRSAAAHRLAEISGAARLAFHRAGVPVALVGPTQVKQYATGHGMSSKDDMGTALADRAGLTLATHDEVDAWWLRAMGLDHLGHPPTILPPAQRAVLDRVTWPIIGQDVIT